VSTVLMYHELQRAGRPLVSDAPGYVRYVLDELRFAEQLRSIAAAGLRGVDLGDALHHHLSDPRQVVITFDDGCESDWEIAAPRLREHGFGATFYVVSGWVGTRPGSLSPTQLRALADAGFEIGSHSATHAFLSELPDAELRRELLDSKCEIEATIGRPVRHLSCPGGRASRRVARAAQEIGYETMATSRPGVNGASTDRFALARCAVLRHTPAKVFERICRGEGLGMLAARDRALGAAKKFLGGRLYTRLRDAAIKP
jgi:peptidoglycan/xylan/chitin deacetylase (PgdA/CDA1 family)